MAWRGSFSRTLMSTARSAPLPRLRPPPISSPRLRSPRLSFTNPRNLGELGCAQSLLPMLAGTRLTSHLRVNVRACSDLCNGTEKMGDTREFGIKRQYKDAAMEELEGRLITDACYTVL